MGKTLEKILQATKPVINRIKEGIKYLGVSLVVATSCLPLQSQTWEYRYSNLCYVNPASVQEIMGTDRKIAYEDPKKGTKRWSSLINSPSISDRYITFVYQEDLNSSAITNFPDDDEEGGRQYPYPAGNVWVKSLDNGTLVRLTEEGYAGGMDIYSDATNDYLTYTNVKGDPLTSSRKTYLVNLRNLDSGPVKNGRLGSEDLQEDPDQPGVMIPKVPRAVYEKNISIVCGSEQCLQPQVDASSDSVVWTTGRYPIDKDTQGWNKIYHHNISSGLTKLIHEEPFDRNKDFGGIIWYKGDLSGPFYAFANYRTGDWDVEAIDVRTGERTTVYSDGGGYQQDLACEYDSTTKKLVVAMEDYNHQILVRQFTFDDDTKELFPDVITNDKYANGIPSDITGANSRTCNDYALRNSVLVWSAWNQATTSYDIYGLNLKNPDAGPFTVYAGAGDQYLVRLNQSYEDRDKISIVFRNDNILNSIVSDPIDVSAATSSPAPSYLPQNVASHDGGLLMMTLKDLPIPTECGLEGTFYLPGDIDRNCHVDLGDLAIASDMWLSATCGGTYCQEDPRQLNYGLEVESRRLYSQIITDLGKSTDPQDPNFTYLATPEIVSNIVAEVYGPRPLAQEHPEMFDYPGFYEDPNYPSAHAEFLNSAEFQKDQATKLYTVTVCDQSLSQKTFSQIIIPTNALEPSYHSSENFHRDWYFQNPTGSDWKLETDGDNTILCSPKPSSDISSSRPFEFNFDSLHGRTTMMPVQFISRDGSNTTQYLNLPVSREFMLYDRTGDGRIDKKDLEEISRNYWLGNMRESPFSNKTVPVDMKFLNNFFAHYGLSEPGLN